MCVWRVQYSCKLKLFEFYFAVPEQQNHKMNLQKYAILQRNEITKLDNEIVIKKTTKNTQRYNNNNN